MASWAAPKWAQPPDRGTPRITKTGKRDAGNTPGAPDATLLVLAGGARRRAVFPARAALREPVEHVVNWRSRQRLRRVDRKDGARGLDERELVAVEVLHEEAPFHERPEARDECFSRLDRRGAAPVRPRGRGPFVLGVARVALGAVLPRQEPIVGEGRAHALHGVVDAVRVVLRGVVWLIHINPAACVDLCHSRDAQTLRRPRPRQIQVHVRR